MAAVHFFHPSHADEAPPSPQGAPWTVQLDRLLATAARRTTFDWETTAAHVRAHSGVAPTAEECRLRWAWLDRRACEAVATQHAIFGWGGADGGPGDAELSRPSDYSIFTRDLSSEIRAIHDEVRMQLPSIGADDDSDADSDGSGDVVVRPILRTAAPPGTSSPGPAGGSDRDHSAAAARADPVGSGAAPAPFPNGGAAPDPEVSDCSELSDDAGAEPRLAQPARAPPPAARAPPAAPAATARPQRPQSAAPGAGGRGRGRDAYAGYGSGGRGAARGGRGGYFASARSDAEEDAEGSDEGEDDEGAWLAARRQLRGPPAARPQTAPVSAPRHRPTSAPPVRGALAARAAAWGNAGSGDGSDEDEEEAAAPPRARTAWAAESAQAAPQPTPPGVEQAAAQPASASGSSVLTDLRSADRAAQRRAEEADARRQRAEAAARRRAEEEATAARRLAEAEAEARAREEAEAAEKGARVAAQAAAEATARAAEAEAAQAAKAQAEAARRVAAEEARVHAAEEAYAALHAAARGPGALGGTAGGGASLYDGAICSSPPLLCVQPGAQAAGTRTHALILRLEGLTEAQLGSLLASVFAAAPGAGGRLPSGEPSGRLPPALVGAALTAWPAAEGEAHGRALALALVEAEAEGASGGASLESWLGATTLGQLTQPPVAPAEAEASAEDGAARALLQTPLSALATLLPAPDEAGAQEEAAGRWLPFFSASPAFGAARLSPPAPSAGAPSASEVTVLLIPLELSPPSAAAAPPTAAGLSVLELLRLTAAAWETQGLSAVGARLLFAQPPLPPHGGSATPRSARAVIGTGGAFARELPANTALSFDTQPSAPARVWLALALRGSGAVERWLRAAGPADGALALRTDPSSLHAVLAARAASLGAGGPGEGGAVGSRTPRGAAGRPALTHALISSARTVSGASRLLAALFGGRLPGAAGAPAAHGVCNDAAQASGGSGPRAQTWDGPLPCLLSWHGARACGALLPAACAGAELGGLLCAMESQGFSVSDVYTGALAPDSRRELAAAMAPAAARRARLVAGEQRTQEKEREEEEAARWTMLLLSRECSSAALVPAFARACDDAARDGVAPSEAGRTAGASASGAALVPDAALVRAAIEASARGACERGPSEATRAGPAWLWGGLAAEPWSSSASVSSSAALALRSLEGGDTTGWHVHLPSFAVVALAADPETAAGGADGSGGWPAGGLAEGAPAPTAVAPRFGIALRALLAELPAPTAGAAARAPAAAAGASDAPAAAAGGGWPARPELLGLKAVSHLPLQLCGRFVLASVADGQEDAAAPGSGAARPLSADGRARRGAEPTPLAPSAAASALGSAAGGPKLLVALRGHDIAAHVRRRLCALAASGAPHAPCAAFVSAGGAAGARHVLTLFSARELRPEPALAARYEGSVDALAPLCLANLTRPAPVQTVPLLLKPHALDRGHLHRAWRALLRAGFEVAAVRLVRLGADGREAVGAAEQELLAGSARARPPSLSAALAGASAAAEPAVEGTGALFALRRPAALRLLRALAGPASPARAKREGAFSLRAMFGADEARNGVQVPAHPAAAAEALRLAFPELGGPPPARRADDAVVPAGVMSAPARRLVRSAAASLSELLLVAVPASLLGADAELVPATLLERALAERFELIGVRVAHLSDAQAARLLCRARAPALPAHALSAGPCVLLALQRDNAIARFSALLRADLRQLAPPHAYASASPAAAAADLADAFDELHGARGFEFVRA